jgi:transposase
VQRGTSLGAVFKCARAYCKADGRGIRGPPFRKRQGAKNDRNDAQAILTAVRQPDTRFVSVKSIDQQAMLAWHRARAGFSEERTALLNRTRGLLSKFGVWLGRSSAAMVTMNSLIGLTLTSC